jgi:AcrR family transcriptional regulator
MVNHGSLLRAGEAAMVYRRTERVARRLAARRVAIIVAAVEAASEGGMAAVQIAPIAARADIAAGTVYRYFPAKTDLVAAVVAALSEREIGAMQQAAESAPGPLSALAASIATFATRALRHRRLVWAAIAEPVEPDIDTARLAFRAAVAVELETRIHAAIDSGHLPDQDAKLAAAALLGALLEALLGPLASPTALDDSRTRDAVQELTLIALRALGVVDARARGLVVQTVLPDGDAAV